MSQPKIQRKIIAILWMSPIYSVTSFLTLWFPSIGGWMAIVKDFYEAYCIYTFLSFLIAVLGHGSRDEAVDVLARHAGRLEQPARCLGCLYEPPPDAGDRAKANAVVTECQIYCLQFTFLRPITTIVFVLLNRNTEGGDQGSSSSSSTTTTTTTTTITGTTSGATSHVQETIAPTGHDEGRPGPSQSNHTGSRSFRYRTRWLQQQQEGTDVPQGTANDNVAPGPVTGTGTDTPGSDLETTAPLPSLAPVEASFAATLAPTIVSSLVATLAPTLTAVIAGPTNQTIGNDDGYGSPFPGPTPVPTTMPPEENGDLLESTKDYFQSPGFALAMVVNVSVFFAFTGLLKFYHAVRDDLKWCRPWPKFLTIKGVVFVTFWQGLAIMIFVVVLADPNDDRDDALYRAHQYQDILICIEMVSSSPPDRPSNGLLVVVVAVVAPAGLSLRSVPSPLFLRWNINFFF
jgi:hypothetical protein